MSLPERLSMAGDPSQCNFATQNKTCKDVFLLEAETATRQ